MTELDIKMATVMLEARDEILRLKAEIKTLKYNDFDVYECSFCNKCNEPPCKLIVEKGCDKPTECPFGGIKTNFILNK